jgi:chromosome segregation ATPase
MHAHPGGAELCVLLETAEATITQLETDRRAARMRIEELERADKTAQARLAAQRHRLLVLERQLEGAGIEPAVELPAAGASWLDRLFGGLSSVTVR